MMRPATVGGRVASSAGSNVRRRSFLAPPDQITYAARCAGAAWNGHPIEIRIEGMVQRVKEKVKRPAAGRVKAAPASAASSAGPEARVKALEEERAHLKAELEAARIRIAALEESRSAVASRIDWVIESLNGIAERGD